jgi:3-polyprenyl-4-hydroxybenzoate decarboxylase
MTHVLGAVPREERLHFGYSINSKNINSATCSLGIFTPVFNSLHVSQHARMHTVSLEEGHKLRMVMKEVILNKISYINMCPICNRYGVVSI